MSSTLASWGNSSFWVDWPVEEQTLPMAGGTQLLDGPFFHSRNRLPGSDEACLLWLRLCHFCPLWGLAIFWTLCGVGSPARHGLDLHLADHLEPCLQVAWHPWSMQFCYRSTLSLATFCCLRVWIWAFAHQAAMESSNQPHRICMN